MAEKKTNRKSNRSFSLDKPVERHFDIEKDIDVQNVISPEKAQQPVAESPSKVPEAATSTFVNPKAVLETHHVPNHAPDKVTSVTTSSKPSKVKGEEKTVVPKAEVASTKKSNSGKIFGIILSIAAIVLLIYFFGIKGNINSAVEQENILTGQIAQDEGDTQEPANKGQTASSEDINEKGNIPTSVNEIDGETELNDSNPEVITETPQTNDVHSETVSNNVVSKSGTAASGDINMAKSLRPNQSNVNTVATTQPTPPISFSEDVEENALRVIRGDFGNGQDRKNRLGAAYAEIQSKVNEMYRQGLVH